MIKSYIDKLAWIYIKDKKILSTRSKGKDAWYIPGDKREGQETNIEALLREIKEELTIDLIPETISLYGVFEAQAHGKPEGTIVRMTCYIAFFKGDIRPSSEIERILFLDSSTKEPMSPVDYIIFADLKEKKLIK